MKTGKKIALMALLGLVGAACADNPQALRTELADPVINADLALMEGISEPDFNDRSNGGNPNFLWLPPVVRDDVTPPGPLVSGLQPTIEICSLHPDGGCIEGTAIEGTAIEEDDHYHYGFKNGIDEKPKEGSPYQVRAFDENGQLLGSFTVELTTNRNIPLKFWKGEGFLDGGFYSEEEKECLTDDRCDLGTIVGDNGGTVEVTATGEGATEIIAAARFPEGWSPGGIDRTVLIDCRNDDPSETANDMSGPLNTGLTQLPWYCDFSVDPPLDPGQEFLDDVVVEVCETVDLEHGGVVLGKSSGESDFKLLPFVTPIELGNCFIDYPGGGIPEVGAAGLWSDVTRRLASAFRVIGPQPLRANMRDGGAGGTVRGFSAINPVIPAAIDVTVVDDEGGLEVTLSQGETVIAAANTNGSGLVDFEGLLEGTYDVTITGETEVEYEGGPSQQVEVIGSGPFEVVFEPIIEENAPTVTSAVPGGGGGVGQMVVFFAENVEFTVPNLIVPNVTATFTVGATSLNGFVFSPPSTDTELYVRVPSSLPVGTAEVTLTNNTSGETGPVFLYDFATRYGTPVIVNAPGTVTFGTEYIVQIRGIDTSGGQACFTQQATAPSSGPVCAGTAVNSLGASSVDGSLSIRVPPPSLTEGQVWIQVRQGSRGAAADSDWSTAEEATFQIPG